ncbi:23854_t:CDS:1 [Dentiscutata erythropus]|uniref:23854_t:CDS:1 n=1 Tax=Dentiscutata erythropus TaxID=1348616 RepID=A0A9N8ZER1_9GLOM|nr:23854_t:CDS:1 [Dentiscutata erythropus]
MEPNRFQFTSNITHSFREEFLQFSPPYKLTIKPNDLISPSLSSRNAVKHKNNPEKFKKPRPLNSFMLFRKNFQAELKSLGVKITNEEVSGLASKIWEEQPASVKYYFDIAAKAADEEHKKDNPNYIFSRKKSSQKIKSNKMSRKKNDNNTNNRFQNHEKHDQLPNVENHPNGDPSEQETFLQMLTELTYIPLDKS